LTKFSDNKFTRPHYFNSNRCKILTLLNKLRIINILKKVIDPQLSISKVVQDFEDQTETIISDAINYTK